MAYPVLDPGRVFMERCERSQLPSKLVDLGDQMGWTWLSFKAKNFNRQPSVVDVSHDAHGDQNLHASVCVSAHM